MSTFLAINWGTLSDFIEDEKFNGKYENLIRLLNKYENNFKWILSTTRAERNVDKINELCKKYYLIVLDYRDAKNKDFLQKLYFRDFRLKILV